jgi:hypothetical protein
MKRKKKWSTRLRDTKSFFFVSALCLLSRLVPGQAAENELTFKEQVQRHKLDSTKSAVLLWYSNTSSTRGFQINGQTESAKLFYWDGLGIDVQINVALCDSKDYVKIATTLPRFGVLFVNHNLIIIPADTSTGTARKMYGPCAGTATKNNISNLKKAESNYKSVLNYIADLTGLHQIGYTQLFAYRIDARQKWRGLYAHKKL